uniref:Unkown protein n=1 Tax=Riptortus pedestris TaxID=329032 RepID=R4WDL5_RIPPE|nr:unkown protein [Riptortus pedestris]
MASLDLDNLSDAEIRVKLVELGQTVGPVTATTRKLYLKKLRSLLDQSQSSVDLNTSAKFDPRNISHSSADEESDEGSSRSTRRSMPPPRSNKSPKRKSPTRATNTQPLANSTFAEHKVTNAPYISPPPASSNLETRRSLRTSVGLNNSTTSQSIYGDDESEHDVSLSRNTRPLLSQASSETYKVSHSPTKFTPEIGTGLSDAFKSRLQASTSSSFTSSYNSPRLSSSNQPYASDFVRKLSANKSGSGITASSISSKLLDVKESDDEDSGSAAQVYTRFTQGSRTPLSAQARGKGTQLYNDSWMPFDSPVSAALLILFSLFFIIIGITYVNMHTTDTSLSSTTDLYYPICTNEESQIPKVNCIRDVDRDLTSKIFKIVYQELHNRLRSSPCSRIGDGPFGISDIDIQAVVLEHDPALGTWITNQQLPNVKVLITANPKLKLADISGGIAIINPQLPFFCYVTNNLMIAANWIFKIFLG